MKLSLEIDNRGNSVGEKVFRIFLIASGAGDRGEHCEDRIIYILYVHLHV